MQRELKYYLQEILESSSLIDKILILFLLLNFILIQNFSLNAQNPITPPGLCIADPSAHVWKDGKMYVYGSFDESRDYYCSRKYVVLSSSNLKNWTVSPESFSTIGNNDQVPYSDEILYAPDCQYKDGTYFLYYCLASNKNTEGVAVSNSPTGPFEKGAIIDLNGINQIDPCVFIDDDRQGYYIWGQMSAKMAKLKPTMTAIDSATIVDNVVTQKEHFFHEGGYMVKRNGIYYFIYAHMGRANRPTCIGYATSRSPMGPFRYGGVIIDNDHCDPGVWNNHGSIVEFRGQWYVFYHRSTDNSVTLRKACLEPIFFNPDGSINEVEMTSQGAGGPLNARDQIEAERACLLFGNVRIHTYEKAQEELTGIQSDDKAAFKYLDFGNGVDSISIKIHTGGNGGKIDLALNDPWGPSIGTLDVIPGKENQGWNILHAKVKKTIGVHALWLRFYPDKPDSFEVDWFRFY